MGAAKHDRQIDRQAVRCELWNRLRRRDGRPPCAPRRPANESTLSVARCRAFRLHVERKLAHEEALGHDANFNAPLKLSYERSAAAVAPGLGHAPVGQRGNVLSGSERQRVALAWAVLQSPGILVLDESTCALDAPSERRVFMNLARHFKNRTIVFVSVLMPN